MTTTVRRLQPRVIDGRAPAPPTQVALPWTKRDDAVFARAAETGKTEHAERTAERQRLAKRDVPRCEGPGWAHPDQRYPDVFVRVPRAVFERWWPQQWTAVLTAAEAGTDGLTVTTTRPRSWRGQPCEGAPVDPDVAYVAEGQDHWRGRTVLYQQNW